MFGGGVWRAGVRYCGGGVRIQVERFDDQRAFGVSHQEGLVLVIVNVLGDDAFGGETFVTNFTKMALVRVVCLAAAAPRAWHLTASIAGEQGQRVLAVLAHDVRVEFGFVDKRLPTFGALERRFLRGRRDRGGRGKMVGDRSRRRWRRRRGRSRRRGLVRVGSHVRVKIGKLSERLVARANVTLVGPFARVTSPMLPEMRELSETFLAKLATVRLFARVYPAVLIEMHLLAKGLEALRTLVGLLATAPTATVSGATVVSSFLVRTARFVSGATVISGRR